MATLTSITHEKVIRPPRMVLLGVEKIGKSTFAAGADNPIFIPIKLEEGIDSLDVPKFPVCKSFEDLLDSIEQLATEDHEFKTVVIDSASALEPIIWESVCNENNVTSIELAGGGYGKGYGFALDKWRELQEALDYLWKEKHMTVIIIGHVKVKRFDDPERPSYDSYCFDINEKVANALYRWADFIGFANKSIGTTEEKQGFKKTKVKGVDLDEDNHYLFTKKAPAHPGGGRGVYGKLPSEVVLNWESFKEAVNEVIEEETPKKKVKK